MKKALLLSALALGFAANAQTVQNIPGDLRLDGDYAVITVDEANMPQPKEDGTIDPLKERRKQDGDGVWQTDNMAVNDKVTMKLNAANASCYIIRFQTGTKNNESQIYFEITDANGDLEWSATHDVFNNGAWNPSAAKWQNNELYISDELTSGEKTLTMTFLSNPDINGNKNTVNARQFSFEARAEINSYSLYTEVDNPEAGSLVINPLQNAYLEGTEVTVTAQANSGYMFNHWENQYGDIIEENPYTVVMTETVELYAYFDEILMYSTVPGRVNFHTTTTGKGKPETKACKLDGESYMDGAEVYYLANYRKGDTEVFELDVTKAGAYTVVAPTATKQEAASVEMAIYDKDEYDAAALEGTAATAEWSDKIVVEKTGNWQQYKTNTLENVNLTEGRKALVLSFNEDSEGSQAGKAYTANFLYIAFGLGDDWGEQPDGIEGINMDAAAPVKAFNLQGIEVAPDTKGLIILSNGTKVYNK